MALTALAPPVALSAGTGTIQDVQHVVILVQENRSFDHYFGSLRGVCGFNDRNAVIQPGGNSVFYQPAAGTGYVLPFHITNACLNDVDHGEGSGLAAWAAGWWNGWVSAKGSPVMCCYTRNEIPFYYALADNYTICDQNFCSFIGPTFPNRLFLFSGTIDPNGANGGPVLGNYFPATGFTWTTYPERLQSAGVSWKVYRPPGDWYGDALQWFTNFMQAQPGNPLYDRGMAVVNDTIAALRSDVTNGSLPAVSWIIPTWEQSEHPSESPDNGEFFVKQIMDALALDSNTVNSTVLIITYDENGGFFDHVPAPIPTVGTPDEYVYGQPTGLGIRVPMLIVSPWTRGGKVCSQIFDHTSVIRFLEQWTGVQEPNISAWRRQACGDLTAAFDFSHPDTSVPNLPAVVPVYAAAITPVPPFPQTVPLQEPGCQTSCPTVYQPEASATCTSNSLMITMTNAGPASVHYWIYPNASASDLPRQYDVAPGNSAVSAWNVPTSGRYDLTCRGPDGFQRRFSGNLHRDFQQLEVTSAVAPEGAGPTLFFQNSSPAMVTFTVTDGYGAAGPWLFPLPANGLGTNSFSSATNNFGWYDLLVTCSGDSRFIRRFAGHIANASPATDNYAGTFGADFISALNGALTNSPLDLINQAIADRTGGSVLPLQGSPLIMTAIGAGGYVALIYPGWAANATIETSADLAQWSVTNAVVAPVNGWSVITLPASAQTAFFRLRQ